MKPKIHFIKMASIALFAIVLFAPISARAQIKAGSYEFTPLVGYNFFEGSQNLDNQYILGGRLGYNFTQYFAIEGGLEFVNTNVDDASLTVFNKGQFRSPIDSVKVKFYHLDAVYHFSPDNNVTPYIVAGLGLVHYSPEISDKDMSTVDIGVGVKYWMDDDLALRFELRDNIVLKKTFHNYQAIVGLVFAVGGDRKAPAPAPVAKQKAPEPVPVARVEPKPEPKPEPEPEPAVMLEPRVIVLPLEPKVEEKVAAIVAEPTVEKKVIVLALEDVHFDFDESILTEEAQVILKRNIQILKDNPKAQVIIAGYTSASGTDEYNQKLSERRSQAVLDYLVQGGVISADRLVTIGYGESNPAEFEAVPKELYSDAAKSNMRVVFGIVLK